MEKEKQGTKAYSYIQEILFFSRTGLQIKFQTLLFLVNTIQEI